MATRPNVKHQLQALIADIQDPDEYDLALAQVIDGWNSAVKSADLLALTSDADPRVRSAALDVLGELTRLNHGDARLSLLIATQASSDDEDDEVRYSAIHAIGRAETEVAPSLIAVFLQDPNAEIRLEALQTLDSSVDADEITTDSEFTKSVMRCLTDPEPAIRDWAAFSLSSFFGEIDSVGIRDALWSLAKSEAEGDAAGEALLALAIRKDVRAVGLVSSRLKQLDVGNLVVEAAARIGDPAFCIDLLVLKTNEWQERGEPRPEVLDMALARCGCCEASPKL
jgi:HEAT repeat protein